MVCEVRDRLHFSWGISIDTATTHFPGLSLQPDIEF